MVNSLAYNESLNYGILELGSKVFNEKEPREIIDEKISLYRQRFAIELTYVDETHLSLSRISKEVISYLYNMPKFVSLDLSKASITHLPNEIANLKLNTLDLTNHNIVCLPDCLGSISTLRTLKISTKISHSIPATLAKLEKLNVLEVNIKGIKNLNVLADYLRMRKVQKSDVPKELKLTYNKEAKSVLYEWVHPLKKHKWNLGIITEPLKIVLTCLEKVDLDICSKVSKTLKNLITQSVPVREVSLADGWQNYLQTTLEKKKNIVQEYNTVLERSPSSLEEKLLKEILFKLYEDQWQLQKLLNEGALLTEGENLLANEEIPDKDEDLSKIKAAIPAPNLPNLSKKMYAITAGVFSLQDPVHPSRTFNEINQTFQQMADVDWSDGYF